MKADQVQIDPSWKEVLAPEFEKPYFEAIKAFLVQEKKAGKNIYPPGPLIFNAFNHTPFDKVRVVILGQDPYHNPGEAMGLCFSVPQGVKVPPSLANIYKEMLSDIGTPIPPNGDLTSWADRGVLLLNAMLTVEGGKPASHQKIGWQTFTDAVIKTISDQKEGVVFLLWGKFAQGKKPLIDELKHYVLEAAHPSPLAGGAFFGCKHFSRTNELLGEIIW
ncbi:MAG: uracil-DNA glycosylase [Lewinellaceae bacterium]|nr:uracil-DNA glycosylase [Lewinellaceae bacterium]